MKYDELTSNTILNLMLFNIMYKKVVFMVRSANY